MSRRKRPEDPHFKELVDRGILKRVYEHPRDGLKNRYVLVDPEGVQRALEDLGMIKERTVH